MVTLTTDAHFETCYDLSKRTIDDTSFGRQDAAKELIRAHSFDEPEPINATLDLIGILPRLLSGDRLTLIRTQKYISYCLNRIFLEEKEYFQENALNALDETIKHQYVRHNSKAPGWRKLHNEFQSLRTEELIFGDEPEYDRIGGEIVDEKFAWTSFYESIADNLRGYEDKQDELYNLIQRHVNRIHDMVIHAGEMDPFSFMSFFNSQTFIGSRQNIANAVAAEFNIVCDGIDSNDFFNGVPIRPPKKAYFVEEKTFQQQRPGQFQKLWAFFNAALRLAKEDNEENRQNFINCYNNSPRVYGTNKNHQAPSRNELTIGIHWICPESYPILDHIDQKYIKLVCSVLNKEDQERIEKVLELHLDPDDRKPCNAEDYLYIRDKLLEAFNYEKCLVHSFPEFSFATRNPKRFENISYSNNNDTKHKEINCGGQEGYNGTSLLKYDFDNMAQKIVDQGCFVEQEKIKKMLKKLVDKKNIILQGPPGTGKTWLAKRLGYALINSKSKEKLVPIQFHPNMSYEDFVMGWRPVGSNKEKQGDGEEQKIDKLPNSRLDLVEGTFIKIAKQAKADEENSYVIVIEEINRGNPAQIFGELLTLLEADKRHESEALNLVYQSSGENFYIPKNLYVIGTMNVADRSLALMDSAFRRRFAFFGLESIFNQDYDKSGKSFDIWSNEVKKSCDIEDAILKKVWGKVQQLNDTIAGDDRLGESFCIGHSYFMPTMQERKLSSSEFNEWFLDVIDSEIAHHLKEYWFDDIKKAKEEIKKLKASND